MRFRFSFAVRRLLFSTFPGIFFLASHKISPFKLHLTQPKKKTEQNSRKKKPDRRKVAKREKKYFLFLPFLLATFLHLATQIALP